MFETVCVREEPAFRSTGDPLDLGALAEAMLFYQNVKVVGRAGAVEQLARSCGIDVMLELVSGGYMDLQYYPDYPSVITENSGTPAERHAPLIAKFGRWELQDVMPDVFTKVIGASGKGRRTARRFEPHIKAFTHATEVETHSRSDFRDPAYLEAAFSSILRQLVPEYGEVVQISVTDAGEGRIRLKTNIDFDKANAIYHTRVPATHSSLSPAYLLSLLVAVRADLDIASHFNAELAVTPISGALARMKVGSILDRYEKSAAHVERFQNLVFDDAKAIREAINDGSRTMADFLEVLRKAERFRDWLKGREGDADLVKEYYRAVTKDTWLDKLPGKASRFAIVTMAGLALGGPVGAVAGVALGAADSFLLDRIVRGWRPNQFVEGPLKGLIEKPAKCL